MHRPSRAEGMGARRKEIPTGEGSGAAEATQDFVDKPPARAPEGRASAAAAQLARLPEAAPLNKKVILIYYVSMDRVGGRSDPVAC